jgi:hypothetical protein
MTGNDQHPDHQFRIDRRATRGRVMKCYFTAKPRQVESRIDLPNKVIFGNCIAKTKLVEQLTFLQTAHHGSTSPRFASAQRNHASRACLNRLLQQNPPITDPA